jgi:hypothetical protein
VCDLMSYRFAVHFQHISDLHLPVHDMKIMNDVPITGVNVLSFLPLLAYLPRLHSLVCGIHLFADAVLD